MSSIAEGPVDEYFAEFSRFEEESRFFEFDIRGFQIWDFIRRSVYYSIIETKNSFAFHKASGFGRYFRYFYEILLWLLFAAHDFWSSLFTNQYDILIVGYDRENKIDGKSVNISFYPVINALKDKYRILYIDPTPLLRGSGSKYGCDIIKSRRYHIADRLALMFFCFNDKEKQILEHINNAIRVRFGIDINVTAIAKNIFAFEIIRYKRYLRLIRRYRPAVVCYADDGNQKGLITAAHRTHIPSVDFQHGQTNPYDILYGYPTSVRNKKFESCSDYVFTFGEFWHRMYNMRIEKRAVGFPYINIKKKEIAAERLPHHKNKEKNIIIITDQYLREIYVDIALKLCAALSDHMFFFKLRVDDFQDWQSRYPDNFGTIPNLLVIDNHDLSLYEIFSVCSYAIGVTSTALYEGLTFGLTTFIWKDKIFHREMLPLTDGGYAILTDNVDQIIGEIRHKNRQNSPVKFEDIFKRDSLQHIERELGTIIKASRSTNLNYE